MRETRISADPDPLFSVKAYLSAHWEKCMDGFFCGRKATCLLTTKGDRMSLRNFTDNFIDSHFPTLGDIVQNELNEQLKKSKSIQTVKPHHDSTDSSKLAGTAIDYRIRKYFSDEFCVANVIPADVEIVDVKDPNEKNILDDLKAAAERTSTARKLLNDIDEDRVCSCCVELAKFEALYREDKAFTGKSIEPMKLRPVIDDTKAISREFYENNQELLSRFRDALPGPKFKGGNRGDLIIDGTLVEIKAFALSLQTRTHPSEPLKFPVRKVVTQGPRDVNDLWKALRQLIRYLLLDYDDKYSINSTEVWLVRHNCRLQFEVKELVGSNRTLQDLRGAFKARLLQREA